MIKKAQKEEYKDYEDIYISNNVKPIGDLIIKSIIQDLLKPSNYSQIDYPFLKYFYFKKEIDKNCIYEKLKNTCILDIPLSFKQFSIKDQSFSKISKQFIFCTQYSLISLSLK